MLYRSVSPKNIIAKAQMSFQLQGNNWQNWAYEWIGDALRGIGNSAGTLKTSMELTSKNHKALLPCDLLEIIAVEYKGNRLKLGGNVRPNAFSPTTKGFGIGYEYPLDNNVGDATVDDSLVEVSKVIYTDDDYYQLNELDVITTSFQEDTFTVFYTAYPTDEEGYPLVPDTYQHSEALQYFILFKLCSGGLKHPVWDVKSSYTMWDDFRKKASNKTIYPSIDSMDRFTNMWCRQVADKFAPAKFFNDSQNIQSIYGI